MLLILCFKHKINKASLTFNSNYYINLNFLKLLGGSRLTPEMSASITIESLNTVLKQTNSIKEVFLTFVEEKFIDPFKKELSKYTTEYVTES